MAQHLLDFERGIVESADEDEGRALDLKPLVIPQRALGPQRAWTAMRLNFTGARHHGLREDDRLADVLRPLDVADKFAVASHLQIPPPSLLGIAESYVLAECNLTAPDDMLVCRRLRIAVAVPRQTGPDGLPYDYETREHFIVQRWQAGDDFPPLEHALAGVPGVPLQRPMDIMRLGDRLIVAEGGEGERVSAVCILQLAGLPPPPDRDAQLLKKLYG
jgi:hypothetical protein